MPARFLHFAVFVIIAALCYATFAVPACQDGSSLVAAAADLPTDPDEGGEEDERGASLNLFEEEQEHADHEAFHFAKIRSGRQAHRSQLLSADFAEELLRPPSRG